MPSVQFFAERTAILRFETVSIVDCFAVLRGEALRGERLAQAQREEGWKAGLSFMEKWRHGERPDNQTGQFDRRKPLPIPANFRSVLQRAL